MKQRSIGGMSGKVTCTLLLHESLVSRCAELMAGSSGGSLVSQLKQIRSNPSDGERIQGTEIVPRLKGKLYKRYIGGKNKFRMFYYYHAPQSLVLPFYITDELRSKLDYRDLRKIVEAAIFIVVDFETNGLEHFLQPNLA